MAQQVITRLNYFLINRNVQLGASYAISDKAGEDLKLVQKDLAEYMNARRPEEIIIGSSSSLQLKILSICLSKNWQKDDEIIVTNSDHEANVSCWTSLKKQGFRIKIWKINEETLEFDTEDLRALLSPRTKMVAMVHASNILGTINPIRKIADIVHDAGALFCVDGVAYAPHRSIDVQDWDVDFYVFSFYKTYGPHQAVLFGKYELLESLEGINHYFINSIPLRFQPGNINYELVYSLGGILEYLEAMYEHHFPHSEETGSRQKIKKAFDLIATHEQSLSERILTYLNSRADIRIIGRTEGDSQVRVPTISFVHDHLKSSQVVERMDHYDIGIRFGDFYAKKIIQDLGLEPKDGVIRASMVHYNSLEEVDRLIDGFDKILS